MISMLNLKAIATKQGLNKTSLTDEQFTEIATAFNEYAEAYSVTNILHWAHLLSQVTHESNGFMAVRENLNYSAQGLLKTFPKYFTTGQAEAYARKPEKIADRVYANRYGNGPEGSGDGFKYRGGGYIQITFKDNYKQLEKDTGMQVVATPELLTIPRNAVISALWYWKKNGLSTLADKDDIIAVTKRINGGTNGLDDREDRLRIAKTVLS